MGLAFDASGRLFATQHGRDQLLQNWGKLYPTLKMTTELPSEELMLETKGGDYGWPFCYYDNFQKKLVLAPEYGGDGGKAVGRLRPEDRAGGGLPGALGAQRPADLQRQGLPRGLSGRRLHRLPRFLEPRAGARRTASTWSSSR